jgi:hypothetical protein
MNSTFLDAAKQGKNRWKDYLFGFSCIIANTWIGVFIALLIRDRFSNNTPQISQQCFVFESLNSWIHACFKEALITELLIKSIPFLFLLSGIYLAVQKIHQRPFLTLITPTNSVQWRRLAVGFGVWFVILSIQLLIQLIQAPQHFEWNFHALPWLFFLPIALILTPLQTSAEELLFRGYFLQAIGQLIKHPVVLAISTSFPFAMAHLSNAEMIHGGLWTGLTYAVLSLFLVVVTLKDNRLELALGIHAANNLFILLIANSVDSSLKSPSILTQTTMTDPKFSFFASLISAIAAYAFLFRDYGNG